MRKFNFDNLAIFSGEYDLLDQLWIDVVTAPSLNLNLFAPQPGPLFATINGTSGDDTLVGQRGDTVNALAGNDTVTAFDGDVIVNGGDGNDTVEIRPDTSGDGFTLDGGGGTDTLIITTAGIEADNYFGGVFSLLSNTIDSGDYINFSVIGFERLIMTGGGYADTLYGGQQDDILDDGAGFLDSGLDNAADILYGFNGDDTLTAHGGNDEIYGGNGDDIIRGGSGDNILDGGSGDDHIISTGNDTIITGSGFDIVEVGQAIRDDSTVIMGDAADTIAFDTLSDIQNGTGASVSLLTIDMGTQTYSQSRTDTSQVLFTDSFMGFVRASGSAFDDLILGTGSFETFMGNDGDDILRGFGGNDTLMGGAGNDTLEGGDGTDKLVGGSGDDVINGGGSGDFFITLSANFGDYLVEQLSQNQYRVTALNGAADGVDILTDVEFITYGESGESFVLEAQVAGAIYLTNDDDTYIGTAGDDIVNARDGNDTLFGGAGDDILSGGDGDDVLQGGAGADRLFGGDGRDVVDYSGAGSAIVVDLNAGTTGGWASNDVLSSIEGVIGSDFDDVITGSDTSFLALYGGSGDDNITGRGIIYGEDGDDTLVSLNGSLIGGAGNDSLTVTTGNGTARYSSHAYDYQIFAQSGGGVTGIEALVNDEGIDSFSGIGYLGFFNGVFSNILTVNSTSSFQSSLRIGSEARDIFRPTGNDNILMGFGGSDIFDNRGGRTMVDYSWADAGLTASLDGAVTQTGGAAGTIYTNIHDLGGTNFDDGLYGDSGANFLRGLDGEDTLNGGGGDDELFGGAGDDIINGGAGDDSAIYATSDINDLTISFVAMGQYEIATSSGEGTDILMDVEFIRMGGTNGTDIDITTLSISTNLTPGDDVWTGTAGDDVINGLAGNDTLNGLAGNDTLNGDEGDDIIDGGMDNDTLNGGDGADQIYGGEGLDILDGGAGADQLFGGPGDDLLTGGEGDDALNGGSGSDTAIYSSSDVNDYQVSETAPGEYVVTAIGGTGEGVDTLTAIEFIRLGGENGTDYAISSLVTNGTIILTEGDDTYSGPSTDVIVNALGGNDIIDGGAGNNTLNGNGGNDTLISLGNDVLNGGAGDDIIEMGGNVFDASTATDGGDDFDTISFSTLAQLPSGNLFLVLDLSGDAYSVRDGGTVVYIDQFTNFENATGTEFGDLLQGDAGANVISGLGGDDTLQGRGGDDMINGGAGSDTAIYSSAVVSDYTILEVSAGVYTVEATGSTTEGLDTLTDVEFLRLGGATYAIETLAGGGTITLTTGDDIYSGGPANVIINALGGDDIIDGGTGNNTLNGDGGDDTLISLGNDVLNGGAGNDTVEMGGNVFDVATATDGGLGFDTISFSTLAQFPSGNLFLVVDLNGGAFSVRDGGTVLYVDQFTNFENATGSEFGDLLQGDAGTNVLSGLGGDDNLQGRDGDDIIDGGAGADTVNGGVGSDTASHVSALASVTAFLGNAALNTGDAAGDSYIDIENITGSDFDDVLGGDSNANIIDGGAGFDIASYETSSTAIVFDGLGLVAASGDIAIDTLVNIEAIRGTDFNDRFFGANDASVFYGGAGADRLFGRNGDDELYGEGGNDIILAGRDNDLLDGGAGNDQLRGNEGDDIIFGGDGNDALAGGAGADAMDGGAGIDRVEYTYGTNAGVTASLGNSAINTGDAAGDTYVNIENLYGTTFVDTLYGDAGNNRIDGRSGNDMLFGGDGNDYLIGGSGNDVLNGEGGNDLFLGQAGSDIYQFDAAHGTDRIVVFTQGEDLIEFTEGVFDFSGLTITQDGAHVNIVSSEGTIIANNSLVTDFTADDFFFAPAPSQEPLQEPLDDTFAQDTIDVMAMDFEALI